MGQELAGGIGDRDDWPMGASSPVPQVDARTHTRRHAHNVNWAIPSRVRVLHVRGGYVRRLFATTRINKFYFLAELGDLLSPSKRYFNKKHAVLLLSYFGNFRRDVTIYLKTISAFGIKKHFICLLNALSKRGTLLRRRFNLNGSTKTF